MTDNTLDITRKDLCLLAICCAIYGEPAKALKYLEKAKESKNA